MLPPSSTTPEDGRSKTSSETLVTYRNTAQHRNPEDDDWNFLVCVDSHEHL
jgi:hypothetical protein